MKTRTATTLFILFILINIVERWGWAEVSQWREDQSTNLWLGYKFFQYFPTPVGLISSKNIPNPNGMPLLGFFLSWLPGLLSISFFLSCLQVLSFAALSFSLLGLNTLAILSTALLSSTLIFKSSSVEFFNQFILLTINNFFLASFFAWLKSKNNSWLPVFLFFILLCPALYLGGIVNSIAYTVLISSVLLWNKQKHQQRIHIQKTTIYYLIFIALLFVSLVWIPYFTHINIGESLDQTQQHLPLWKRGWRVFDCLIRTPLWINYWSHPADFVHFDRKLIGDSGPLAVTIIILKWLWLAQAMLCLLALAYEWKHWKKPSFSSYFLFLFLFVLCSYALSPLLGGPSWHRADRLDQAIQFQAPILCCLFLLPLFGKHWLKKTTIANAMLFIALSTWCGFQTIHIHKTYKGAYLSEADVPLIHKLKALEFIVQDWKAIHPERRQIPVTYNLEGMWPYIEPLISPKLRQWYPENPMTIGRALDFELLRSFQFKNAFENQIPRPRFDGRYVLSYNFEPLAPELHGPRLRHSQFGRIRVSVDPSK